MSWYILESRNGGEIGLGTLSGLVGYLKTCWRCPDAASTHRNSSICHFVSDLRLKWTCVSIQLLCHKLLVAARAILQIQCFV